MGLKERENKFLIKAREIHGDKYDYSKVNYINNKTNVIIICPIHGEFEQTPDKHINRQQGCSKCAGVNLKTNSIFIKEAREIHGDKYDYSKVNYINNKTNVIIICPIHGEFEQIPKIHLLGSGCPKCSNKNKDIDTIISEFRKIHNNKYDYSKIKYSGPKNKLIITCPIHGDFTQTYNTHKNGHGCPKCSGNNKSNNIEFIKEAREIHGDKYDYSKVNYINSNTNVTIICPIHGEYKQTPYSHLRGSKCKKCCGLYSNIDIFIKKSNLVHNNKYNYSKSIYKTAKNKLIITCPIHGEFEQTPNNHLNGKGCPKCSNFGTSKPEKLLKEYIKSIYNCDIIENSRDIISPQELDIYLPNKNIAIEFNGLRWHNELFVDNNYHLNKTKECEVKGIRLIHVFEDEWLYKQDIVKSRLKNVLGLTVNKIFARKCEIREVNIKDSREFLNNNHLQGEVRSSVNIGLYYNNELVSLMCFNKPRIGIGKQYDGYELSRFSSIINTNVIGAASRLLKYFETKYKPNQIISYADLRWSEGDLYQKLGFEESHRNKPNYWYIIQSERKHRFGFRKHRLKDKGFNIENKTEHEIMLENNIYRIYDCGTITYKKNHYFNK